MKLRSEGALGAFDLGIPSAAQSPACCYSACACAEKSVLPTTVVSLATPIKSLRNLRLVSNNLVISTSTTTLASQAANLDTYRMEVDPQALQMASTI